MVQVFEIFLHLFFMFAGLGLGLAMVSNLTYRSHKVIKVKGIRPFKLLVLSVVLMGFIAYEPELLGFLFFFLYALSGPIEWVLGWKKPVDDDEIFASIDENHQIDEQDK